MRPALRPLALFTAALLTGCVTSPVSVPPYRFSGERAYQTFCSSCHGLTGHGDGPVQPYVHNVPDLTQIAARRGGQFSRDEIHRIIDGRTQLDAHGTRKMPVWGWELYGNAYSDKVNQQRTDRMVDRLVAHLESMQQPGPERD